MSVEENKAVVRQYFAALDRKQLDAVADVFAPDYRLRFDGNPEMDRASALGMFGMFLNALPDVHHEILDSFGEGDRVVARIEVRGTHRGDLMGIPPTGKAVAIGATNIMRLEQGKIVQHWTNTDMLGMMQQLGVIPAPDQSAA
jgi:steroid delta-isomerase-like uncharacterized protein